ncbi:hypothetical protein MG293_000835 [Ovis ammon polii]|uniref:Uncharacterized protein n=1 Tax=Ovis ammon polii TaxID=230172 RepID=A0AAD4UQE3_OVIAM|nr:hypothetical protein MG293_000835 [Ovis ammon polii]
MKDDLMIHEQEVTGLLMKSSLVVKWWLRPKQAIVEEGQALNNWLMPTDTGEEITVKLGSNQDTLQWMNFWNHFDFKFPLAIQRDMLKCSFFEKDFSAKVFCTEKCFKGNKKESVMDRAIRAGQVFSCTCRALWYHRKGNPRLEAGSFHMYRLTCPSSYQRNRLPFGFDYNKVFPRCLQDMNLTYVTGARQVLVNIRTVYRPLKSIIQCLKVTRNMDMKAFQVALVLKNLPANAGDLDLGSIPRSGRSPGGDNPLQYSCLENPMDREACSEKSTLKQEVK